MHNSYRIIKQLILSVSSLFILSWLECCSNGRYEQVAEIKPSYDQEQELNAPNSGNDNKLTEQRQTNADSGKNSEQADKFAVSKTDQDNQAILNKKTRDSKEAEPKRIYSGFGQLKVDSPENEKKAITELAQTNGGYVEGIYENTIVIRVPAEKFAILFEQILNHGEILFKRTETIDVTEAFTDLSTRLELALKTRDRLYNLLEKTDDVEERLQILREIKRLTEEIERIKLSLKLLESQIAYSRIVLELFARLSEDKVKKETIPFEWLARLTPLYPSLVELTGSVELKLNDEFAIFSQEKIYRAESAEGTRIRIGTSKNKPRGDSEFWQKALHFHLQTYYKQAEKLTLGNLQAVLFTSKDREAFAYLVGVWAKADLLHVVEVFFPTQEALATRLGSVKEALSKINIK